MPLGELTVLQRTPGTEENRREGEREWEGRGIGPPSKIVNMPMLETILCGTVSKTMSHI